MENLAKLLIIAKRKVIYDKNNPWSDGSKTYLNEIKKEIDEVIEEVDNNRLNYLEDELGDVLWDYLNILLNLVDEKGINIDSVLERACKKYDERISGIEQGIDWKNIKNKQKKELEKEHNILINTK